jgi:hypothetical protein
MNLLRRFSRESCAFVLPGEGCLLPDVAKQAISHALRTCQAENDQGSVCAALIGQSGGWPNQVELRAERLPGAGVGPAARRSRSAVQSYRRPAAFGTGSPELTDAAAGDADAL